MSTKSERKEEKDQLKVILESGIHLDSSVAKNLIRRGMFAEKKHEHETDKDIKNKLRNFLG